MRKNHFTPKKIARIRSRTRFIAGLNKFLYLTTAVAFGFLIFATAIPEKQEYEKLQAKLKNLEEREQTTIDRRQYREIQLHALREDQSYLEVRARDRLNYYRDGERVLRFETDR